MLNAGGAAAIMAALTMTQRTPSNTQLAYKPPSPGGPVLGAPITSPAYADGDLQRFMRSQLAKLGKSYAAPAAAPKMLHVGINYSEDSPMSLSRCINDATIFAWMAQSVYGRRADEVMKGPSQLPAVQSSTPCMQLS